uniref:Uncharacterized protein n=1 Tax=Arion vulgaris TaxID=1028688 RepID=A0A0B7ACN7_9EUPU
MELRTGGSEDALLPLPKTDAVLLSEAGDNNSLEKLPAELEVESEDSTPVLDISLEFRLECLYPGADV